MTDAELAIYIGAKIKEFRLLRGLTQKELAKLVNIGDTTIANYEKGYRTPKKNTMFDLANAFNVSIDDLFPPIQKDTPPATSPIQTIYDKLEPPRQGKVLTFAERQLKEQNEEETKINEVSEKIVQLYGYDYYDHAASAGTGQYLNDVRV